MVSRFLALLEMAWATRTALCTLAFAFAASASAAPDDATRAASLVPPASTAAAPVMPEVVPTNSIYQLNVALTDQSGQTFALAARKGQPMLVSMFYTSCKFVCPMLIEATQSIEAQLSAAERARLRVLMVSFDPAHDSVAVLKAMANDRGLDLHHWALARSDAKSVRKLAAVLGIQYRSIGNGDFNHTTALILVDAQGRVVARTTELGSDDAAFVAQLRQTLAAQDQ